MTSQTDRAVIIYSGGLDSTTLLYKLVYEDIGASRLTALTFDYGQRHFREIMFASINTGKLGVEHRILKLAPLTREILSSSALIQGGPPVPDLEEVKDLRHPTTYVPMRNTIMLSIATAFAENSGCNKVFYAPHIGDQYGYWDCTPEYVDTFNEVLKLNVLHPITLEAPFRTFLKSDIVRLGLSLHVNYKETWSCYRGEEPACGTCPTCRERIAAFEALGVNDPLDYLLI